MRFAILFIFTIVYAFVDNRFIRRFSIVCRYNRSILKSIVDEKAGEYKLKISQKDLDRTYIENLSYSGTEEIVNTMKESLSYIFEINKEYFYFLTILINELIKQLLKEVSTFNDDEVILRLFIKNVIIPIMIHDSIKLLTTLLKEIYNFIYHK